MRHGLLLTAVATVTVPGLLAVLGVVGHDHQEAGAAAAVAALGTVALSGPFPVAPPTARAGVRNEVAAVQRASGATVTVIGQQTTGQRAEGTRLLGQAADAVQSTSYQGTELVVQSGVGGSVRETSQVLHRAGGETVVATSGGGTAAAAAAPTADAGRTEGVFGITRSLVTLLSKHYVAAYDGAGSAAGRPASVVELYRFDGSLAARYWLDKQTMLPLRRELLAGEGQVISEDSFVTVQFGAAAGSGQPVRAKALAPALAAPAAGSAWATAAPSALAAQGWPVPRTLPGGLPLYAAASTSTASGKVVDLEYSDGLYTVSLFAQRGDLAASLPGWQPVTVGGQRAFAAGHSVTWSGVGYVYTVIADAPPQTVTEVIGAVPDSEPPGLLDRLGRGLGRLAGMVNPFN